MFNLNLQKFKELGWYQRSNFRIFENIIFCFVVDIRDLVHDVGAIFHFLNC